MKTKHFILDVIKLLKPTYYDKITWAIVSVGLVLISPPLITIILHIFISSINQFNLIGGYDILWGFLLVIIALVYNIIARMIERSKNQKSITSNIVSNTGNGAIVTQNTYNIFITDGKDFEKIWHTIQITDNKSQISYLQSNFITSFKSLYGCLPWVKSISLIKIYNKVELFSCDYETSKHEANQFYLYVNQSKNELLKLPATERTFEERPIYTAVFWEKFKYWTINSLDSFSTCDMTFEESLKNDLSIVIGDVTFIVDKLDLRLTYNKNINSSDSIIHEEFGSLAKAELIVNGTYIELKQYELAIIDSSFDNKIVDKTISGSITTTIESIGNVHIIKLSSLIIRVFSKFEKEYDLNQMINIRMLIIEFFKKANIKMSYTLPSLRTKDSDYLFKQAFSDTWVHDEYKKI